MTLKIDHLYVLIIKAYCVYGVTYNVNNSIKIEMLVRQTRYDTTISFSTKRACVFQDKHQMSSYYKIHCFLQKIMKKILYFHGIYVYMDFVKL